MASSSEARPPGPAVAPRERTARAARRSTSVANSARSWAWSPPLDPRRVRALRVGQRAHRTRLADRLVDLHDALAEGDEALVGGQLPAHLGELRARRQLSPPGRAARGRAGPQVAWPVARVGRVRAGAVPLAAPAVVLADATASEVAGRGQLRVQLGPLPFQLRKRRSHVTLPSSCPPHNQITIGPRSLPTRPTFLSRTPLEVRARQRRASPCTIDGPMRSDPMCPMCSCSTRGRRGARGRSGGHPAAD